ncbi:MAG TPA: respiratory nitrate reductase subunit gamma [Rhodocyclaceae bacterium]|nr:respiratory nitrate reductase subunit gamma [Rhodocyclaceae bacterium]
MSECWLHYEREQYTWKTDSTQLLSNKGMLLVSNFFHIGILVIFGGHFAGLVLPHSFWLGRAYQLVRAKRR